VEITSLIDRELSATFMDPSPRRNRILDFPLLNQRNSHDICNSWNYDDWMRKLRRPNPSPKQSLADKWREYHGANDWRDLLDPLDENLRREIVKYGEFAQATYDAFNSDPQSSSYGSCCIPCDSFFERVGLKNTGYKVTKYLHATANVDVPHWLSKISNDTFKCQQSNWMGFVAVSDNLQEIKRLGRRDIVIAWRGTMTPLEWAENLKTDLKPIKLSDNMDHSYLNPKVENGFLSLYTSKGDSGNDDHNNSMKSASEQVMEEVQRLLELYEGEELSITITGHSLGASLALLTAYQIGENLRSRSNNASVAVFSFGGPRVGNHDFKQRLEEIGVKTLRIVNTHDWIPQIPGIFMNEWLHKKCCEILNSKGLMKAMEKMSFAHVGAELRINHLDSPYLKDNAGVSCCHNLEAHLHLVDGFQSSGVPFRPNAKRDYALVNKTCNLLKDELMVPANWQQLSSHHNTDFSSNFNDSHSLYPL
jgi:hypothetical protein